MVESRGVLERAGAYSTPTPSAGVGEFWRRVSASCSRCRREGALCRKHSIAAEIAEGSDVVGVGRVEVRDGVLLLTEVVTVYSNSYRLLVASGSIAVLSKPLFTFRGSGEDPSFDRILEALKSSEAFMREYKSVKLSRITPRVYVLHDLLRDALESPEGFEAGVGDGRLLFCREDGCIEFYASGSDLVVEAEQRDGARITVKGFMDGAADDGFVSIASGEVFNILYDRAGIVFTPRRAVEKLIVSYWRAMLSTLNESVPGSLSAGSGGVSEPAGQVEVQSQRRVEGAGPGGRTVTLLQWLR